MEVVGHQTFNSPSGSGGGGDVLGLSYSSLLCVGYVNLNCLSNKVSHVQLLLKTNDIDILGIGESWLVQSINDSYVEIDHYRIIRKDDPSNLKKHGVAVYIREGIKFVEVSCNLKN